MISSRFFKFVDPTMGAETPSLESIQAIETWAMLTLFFFASSSTLYEDESTLQQREVDASYIPRNDRRRCGILVPSKEARK